MNSAKRLADLVKSLQTTKNYSTSILALFKIEEQYERLMIHRYFLNDIKNIERVLKQKGKYKIIHQNKLSNLAEFISPFFNSFHIAAYQETSNYIETIESFFEDEVLYNEDIEKIRTALKGISKTDTVLDLILDDIDDLANYYGYFGNTIVEEKSAKIISKTFINFEVLKDLGLKYKKHIKIIVLFYSFYKKIKSTVSEVREVCDYLETTFSEDKLLENQTEILEAETTE